MRLKCGEIFNDYFITYFPLSLTVKEFWKSVNIWWSYGQESSVLYMFHFLRHPVERHKATKFCITGVGKRRVSCTWSNPKARGFSPHFFLRGGGLLYTPRRPHGMKHNNQILHGEENFYTVASTKHPALIQIFVTQMLTRDLFAVAKLLFVCRRVLKYGQISRVVTPPPIGYGAIKRWCASDVCRSDTCLSRRLTFVCPLCTSELSREQRPSKTNWHRGSPRHTWLGHHFQCQKVKGQLVNIAMLQYTGRWSRKNRTNFNAL